MAAEAPIIDGHPLATARAAVMEEIENRKADGEETRDLEELLKAFEGKVS